MAWEETFDKIETHHLALKRGLLLLKAELEEMKRDSERLDFLHDYVFDNMGAEIYVHNNALGEDEIFFEIDETASGIDLRNAIDMLMEIETL